MNNSKAVELFEKVPVSQAVLKNALPAMAAMLMVLIYNLADTFFIGQTHDALQVAAVSLAMPVFLMFMAVGTVFGMVLSYNRDNTGKPCSTRVSGACPFFH